MRIDTGHLRLTPAAVALRWRYEPEAAMAVLTACLCGDGDGKDRRKVSPHLAVHWLSQEDRQRILLIWYQPAYASLPPGLLVLALADQGVHIGSESCFSSGFALGGSLP